MQTSGPWIKGSESAPQPDADGQQPQSCVGRSVGFTEIRNHCAPPASKFTIRPFGVCKGVSAKTAPHSAAAQMVPLGVSGMDVSATQNRSMRCMFIATPRRRVVQSADRPPRMAGRTSSAFWRSSGFSISSQPRFPHFDASCMPIGMKPKRPSMKENSAAAVWRSMLSSSVTRLTAIPKPGPSHCPSDSASRTCIRCWRLRSSVHGHWRPVQVTLLRKPSVWPLSCARQMPHRPQLVSRRVVGSNEPVRVQPCSTPIKNLFAELWQIHDAMPQNTIFSTTECAISRQARTDSAVVA